MLSKKYGLLPNDALIAATCKHYGIRKIATFDRDFKRTDFCVVGALISLFSFNPHATK
ncbi:MAG: PIN domain-containing protein [Archaeoglobaceae archaeon]